MTRCKSIGLLCLLALPAFPQVILGIDADTTPCLVLVSSPDGASALEPSGMVWDGDETLYIVSDNGQIVSTAVANPIGTNPTHWTVLFKKPDTKGNAKKDYDFESVARIPSQKGFLYVGIEGDTCSKCTRSTIKEFSISSHSFTSNQWLLGGKNMEAMTFVPVVPVNEATGFQGYFLVARSNSKTLQRFDFFVKDGAKSVSENSAVPTFDPAIKSKTSDFQYSPGNSTLYVTYDDEGKHDKKKPGNQRVEQYTRLANGNFTQNNVEPLPYSRGVEAVADVTSNGNLSLYIGIDRSKQQRPTASSPNRIDLYSPWPSPTSCPCAAATSCDLIKTTSCGWCASLDRAMAGTKSGGPTTGSCDNWIWSHSNCNCAAITKCSEIGKKGNGNCGWCQTTRQAMAKEGTMPAYGSCSEWKPTSNDCPKN